VPDQEEEAIRLATDEKRLLPGEEPGSELRGDATHWVEVYTQLRQTKRTLIGNLKDMMERQSQEAQDELERADVRVLELQVERFERRLAFWKAKLAGLDGHDGHDGHHGHDGHQAGYRPESSNAGSE
jgi:hypothetical protein